MPIHTTASRKGVLSLGNLQLYNKPLKSLLFVAQGDNTSVLSGFCKYNLEKWHGEELLGSCIFHLLSRSVL
jgi:hypothetical protein